MPIRLDDWSELIFDLCQGSADETTVIPSIVERKELARAIPDGGQERVKDTNVEGEAEKRTFESLASSALLLCTLLTSRYGSWRLRCKLDGRRATDLQGSTALVCAGRVGIISRRQPGPGVVAVGRQHGPSFSIWSSGEGAAVEVPTLENKQVGVDGSVCAHETSRSCFISPARRRRNVRRADDTLENNTPLTPLAPSPKRFFA